jgi:hypothetical protein
MFGRIGSPGMQARLRTAGLGGGVRSSRSAQERGTAYHFKGFGKGCTGLERVLGWLGDLGTEHGIFAVIARRAWSEKVTRRSYSVPYLRPPA